MIDYKLVSVVNDGRSKITKYRVYEGNDRLVDEMGVDSITPTGKQVSRYARSVILDEKDAWLLSGMNERIEVGKQMAADNPSKIVIEKQRM